MGKFHGPKVYGTATVGERGQVVIPVALRKSFKIKSGDKLFIFAKSDEFISLMPEGQFNKCLDHMTKMLTTIKKSASEKNSE